MKVLAWPWCKRRSGGKFPKCRFKKRSASRPPRGARRAQPPSRNQSARQMELQTRRRPALQRIRRRSRTTRRRKTNRHRVRGKNRNQIPTGGEAARVTVKENRECEVNGLRSSAVSRVAGFCLNLRR